MTRLTLVPTPQAARHAVRNIESAARRRSRLGATVVSLFRHPRSGHGKVVDLRAYTGRNVISFPGPDEPTPAA